MGHELRGCPTTRRACTTLIHSDRAEVDAWLDDHRTLGQLARTRGWTSQRRLAHALVAPRLKGVRPAMRAVLERRALETLTQGHLSNHMIFHVFHTPAIADHAKSVFGLRPATFRHLRDSGLSPAAIAQRGGRTRAGAQARLAALLKARGERAVSLGAMSRAQARALYGEQMAALPAFMAPHLPHAVAAGQLPLPAALTVEPRPPPAHSIAPPCDPCVDLEEGNMSGLRKRTRTRLMARAWTGCRATSGS